MPTHSVLLVPQESDPAPKETAMNTYQLTLSYLRIDAEDFDQLDAIAVAAPEAHVVVVDGQARVVANQVAMSAVEAVELLVEAVHQAVPEAVPVASEVSLMSISEIAASVGLNREAIRLWTIGKRGPGNFPKPLDVVGDRIKVWAARDVWNWLVENSVPCSDARPLSLGEAIDATRAMQRMRRSWANKPTLTDAAHWRVARHDETAVEVQRAEPSGLTDRRWQKAASL
jgi:hypothetical protein